MNISAKDTVKSVMVDNSAIFALGNNLIYEALRDRKKTDFVPLSRGLLADKHIPTRSVKEITMQELDTIQNNLSGYEYFEKALAVMLNIEEREVVNLRFLHAYRYFIEILHELKEVAKMWGSLKLPLTAEERRAKVKRPNATLYGICQSYAEAMGGGPKGVQDAWTTPWVEVFNYMQTKYYDVLEQRKMMEQAKRKK